MGRAITDHGGMRILTTAAVLLFLTSCSPGVDPYPWFQGQWISDSGVTMANNPQYDRLEPEDYARVRAGYGKVRWTISGNTLLFYNPVTQFDNETEFSVEMIDEDTFNLRDNWGGHLRLWKSRTGFCMQTVILAELQDITECFRPFVSEG